MTSRSAFYGVTVAAVALLLITATVAGYYYFQDSNASSNNAQLTSELNNANANYSSLASNFNTLLSRYNQSIYLLSNSLAVMNTSLPAYQQASAQLAALWATYQSLTPAPKALLHDSVYFAFGNGTSRWYNGTAINAGWNLYIETVVLMKGQVAGTWYASPASIGSSGPTTRPHRGRWPSWVPTMSLQPLVRCTPGPTAVPMPTSTRPAPREVAGSYSPAPLGFQLQMKSSALLRTARCTNSTASASISWQLL